MSNEQMTDARREELIAFLDGSGTLDGVWFGEKHPTERGAFWWRKELGRLRGEAAQGCPSCGKEFAASAAPAPVAGDDARDLIEGFVQHADANAHDGYPRKLVESAKSWLAGFRDPVAGDAVAKLPADVQQMVAKDDAAWSLAKMAESFGAERDEDDSSTWWVLRIDHFRALAQDRASQAPDCYPDCIDPDCSCMELRADRASQAGAAGGAPKWPVTMKSEGSCRDVTQQVLHWRGIPVYVTGRVWTHDENWPLIDAAPQPDAEREVGRG